MQVARRAGATYFVLLVKRAGLFEDLVSFGPYTIFAPSNTALKSMPVFIDIIDSKIMSVHIVVMGISFHII